MTQHRWHFFDEVVAADLIETLIMSGDSAVEPFKTLQANHVKD